LKNIKETREAKNIVPVYFCDNCNEKIRDFRFDDLKIKKYNYCPYCGIELNWEE
jgi:DNA-directed RNA polymerase subunit RPC12/RpoP